MIHKEYGGYLPLELPEIRGHFYQSCKNYNVINLNSGRSSFYYAIKAGNIKKIYIPYLSCPKTSDPFLINNVDINYYFLDENLIPNDLELGRNDFLLWTNYYGNANLSEVNYIVKKYKNLIIDNCNAFFFPPINGVYNCYSARKFFGVSDGAYLIKNNLDISIPMPVGSSYQNTTHLIKQIDCGTNDSYSYHLDNEDRLCNQYSMMSSFTETILKSINYKLIKRKRYQNFLTMHKILKKYNKFKVNLKSKTHLFYPFLTNKADLRYKLLNRKVYNPMLWKHVIDIVKKDTIEYNLSKYLVLLPIDQRYGEMDIKLISNIVLEELID